MVTSKQLKDAATGEVQYQGETELSGTLSTAPSAKRRQHRHARAHNEALDAYEKQQLCKEMGIDPKDLEE